MRPPPTSPLFPYTTLFRSQSDKSQPDGGFAAACGFVPGNASLQLALALKAGGANGQNRTRLDRKSTRLNSSHMSISYAVFCLKKKTISIGECVAITNCAFC